MLAFKFSYLFLWKTFQEVFSSLATDLSSVHLSDPQIFLHRVGESLLLVLAGNANLRFRAISTLSQSIFSKSSKSQRTENHISLMLSVHAMEHPIKKIQKLIKPNGIWAHYFFNYSQKWMSRENNNNREEYSQALHTLSLFEILHHWKLQTNLNTNVSICPELWMLHPWQYFKTRLDGTLSNLV